MNLFGKLEAQDDPLFSLFWDAYNDKRCKGDARTAWRKAIKKEYPHNIIMAAQQYAATRDPKNKQFWPHPARWLNGERWLEQQPKEEVKAKQIDAKLNAVTWAVKRCLHTTRISNQDVLSAYRAGKVTAEECEKYGVRV